MDRKKTLKVLRGFITRSIYKMHNNYKEIYGGVLAQKANPGIHEIGLKPLRNGSRNGA